MAAEFLLTYVNLVNVYAMAVCRNRRSKYRGISKI